MTMEELDQCFAKGGALEALLEAKEQGMIKHISISGHTNPEVQLEASNDFRSTAHLWHYLQRIISSTASLMNFCQRRRERRRYHRHESHGAWKAGSMV